MRNFFFKKLLGKSGDFFSGENLTKVTTIMSQFTDIEKIANQAIGEISTLSQKIKDNTDIPCEMIATEKLDKEMLKQIVQETEEKGAVFLALLNQGRNKKDELEIFLQYLNAEKQALIFNKVICIRCQMIAEDLKESFGDKNLLIVKL
jgi:hypothetical protein